MIGQFPDRNSATVFGDYLYVQGISNLVEEEPQGWAVWIHSEDELEKAQALLAGYLKNPGDPRYQHRGPQAEALREKERREEEAAGARHFDRSRLFRPALPLGVGRLTLGLILISVVVYLLARTLDLRLESWLFISLYPRGLPEVLSGQLWRLVTPIFIHGGILHLVFNMLWLYDLGSMIENRQGTRRLLVLVAVIATLSNLGQFFVSGPYFGGMSGVVYGLLGYVWMRGKFDPRSGLFLHPQTVAMMLIWFFVCLFGLIPRVANTAHGVGLVLGIVWGYLSCGRVNGSDRA